MDLEQMYQALAAADSQGATEDAQAIANMIARAQAAAVPPPPQQQPEPVSKMDQVTKAAAESFWSPFGSGGSPNQPHQAQDSFLDSVAWGAGPAIKSAGTALSDIAVRDDVSLQDFPSQYKKRREEYRSKKDQFKKENPKTALATDIAGSMVGGSVPLMGGAKIALPTVKHAMGYGALEGSVQGYLGADPGKEKGAAVAGAVFGGLAPGLMVGVEKIAKGVPKLMSGLRKMIPGAEPQLTEETLDAAAKRAMTIQADRLGVNNGVLSDPDLVVAEKMTGGQNLLESVAAYSDEGGKLLKDSDILQRADAKKSVERLRKNTKLDDSTIHDLITTEVKLDSKLSDVGSLIEEQVVKTRNKPLANQEEFFRQMELPGNKGILRKAVNRLKNRGKEPLRDPNAEDPNAIIANEELVQEIASIMSGKTKSLRPTKFESKDPSEYAESVELYSRFNDFLVDSTSDPTLKALRDQYRIIGREQAALQEGFMAKGLEDSKSLVESLASKGTTNETDLYRKGVQGNLASKGNLQGRLSEGDTLSRYDKIAGNTDETEAFSKAVAKENTISETAKRVQKGLNQLYGDTAGGTLGGKTQKRAETIMEAIVGKRAYSIPGAGWLLSNEVLESVNRTDLPEAVSVRIAEMLTKSGDDGTKFLQDLLASDLPKYQKQKAAEAVARGVRNVRATALAAGASTGIQSALGAR
jgi:hypothetical protein